MDDYISRYIILGILVLLSAFFSSAETAFSSVNIIRLKNYLEDHKRGAKKALYVAEHYDETLSTILIGNNLVNIGAAALATTIFTDQFGKAYGPLISTAVLTIIILIFGEVLPKSFAKEHAEKLSLTIGGIIFALSKIFKPIIALFILLKKLFNKIMRTTEKENISVTEDELEYIIDTMEEEGVLEEEESEMLQKVLDLDETTVYEIFTPRVDMVAVRVDSEIDDVKEIFFKEKFSRVPVYEDTVDNIVGLLYERDFLTSLIKGNKISINELMREPLYVPKSMKASDLLTLLQKNKQHMAIVSDEYGGTAGVVTLEDAIEELVGEIYDEHDIEIIDFVKIEDNLYEINAEYDLDDFFDELELGDVPESHYSTVGGWLYELFETIPNCGDTMKYTTSRVFDEDDNDIVELIDLLFTVKELEDRRMKTIILEISRKREGEE